MRSLRQKLRGFTLIEIIVVIAVIGILASITAFGFGRFQADSRDTQRATATAVIVEGLEKYFDENGEYPGCPVISGDINTLTTDVLPGLDNRVFVAPNAPSNVENSLSCNELTLNGEDFFQYQGFGGAACTAGDACLGYSLRYISESDNEIVEVFGRRTTPIDSTGTIANLTATPASFTSINLSWGEILEADGYRIERASNNTFTSNVVSQDVTETSASITGLTINTTYYFRVTQLIGPTPGNWSNTATTTTLNLLAPTMSTANVASATSVTVNWNNVANEASYTVRYSTTSGFTSNVSTITGIAANATSRTVTGLTSGTTYYFQVRAENGSVITAWANTPALSATPIGQATGVNIQASSCGQVTLAWTATAGAANYTIRHATSSGMSGATVISGATGTSRVITGLPQGATRYFTVAAVASAGNEGAQSSPAVSHDVTVCPPASHTVTRNTGVTTGLQASSNASCASGTDEFYQWYANGSAWVSGTGASRQTVTYSLNYGQGITLTVSVRCQTATEQSSMVAASNSVSYTRPGMNLSMSAGADGCSGSFCGRLIAASWNNVCGAAIGSMRIYATQYSYNTNFQPETTTFHDTRWKGASSPGAPLTYNVNISCTSQSRTINVISAYKCTGCS